MGYNASSSAPEGDYYLMTKSEKEYGLQVLGTAPFIEKNPSSGGGTYSFQ